ATRAPFAGSGPRPGSPPPIGARDRLASYVYVVRAGGMGSVAAWKALAVVVAAAGAGLAVELARAPAASRGPALATCFWEGPISTQRPTTKGFDGRNFNFPEESATYWLARFDLPSDATLILR